MNVVQLITAVSCLAGTLFLSRCAAPRSIMDSAYATPPGTVRIGTDMTVNIPTQTISSIFPGIENSIKVIVSQDTIYVDKVLNDIAKSTISYGLDPFGTGYDFYIRTGIIKRLDCGYRYAAGAHAFDALYQFLGSCGNMSTADRFFGAAGLRFSMQSYKLPSKYLLDKLQDILGYTFKRKDILVPLIFTGSFGEHEKYGSLSYGIATGITMIDYGFVPKNIFNPDSTAVFAVHYKKRYYSFGGFANIKAGYDFIYAIASLSIYYQKYGEFALLGNNKALLKGISIIPTIGVQFAPRSSKRKES